MLKIVVDMYTNVPRQLAGGFAEIVFLPEGNYSGFFAGLVEAGHEVLFLQTGFKLLTETGKTIKAVVKEIKAQHPASRIEYLDTHTAMSAIGLIASFCAAAANKGSAFQDVMELAVSLIGRFAVVFTVDNIDTIKKDPLFKKALGGFAGELINNKPIFCVNNKGELVLLDKRRGFKTAVNALYKIAKDNGENIADYQVFIGHINAKEEAEALKLKFADTVGENVIVSEAPVAMAKKFNSIGVSVAFHMRLDKVRRETA
ncbi:MAG: DegV family protein [Firmicutes bacterium]|nr:DegV family protein [Bacillota bacterium]